MRICAGTKRIALVTETCTYKIPKPAIKTFARIVVDTVFRKQFISSPIKSWQIIRSIFPRMVTAGWNKNRTESKISKTLAELAVATRFSLWGLVNVQETATPSGLPWFAVHKEIWNEFDFETCNNYLADFGHALDSGNFGFQNGKLKFVDYGNEELAQFISQHKAAFERALAKFKCPAS